MEVIIVDGGSKDNTLGIVKGFAKLSSDGLVVKIFEEHGYCRSPANARNIGFINAHGKYVVFIDADCMFLDNDFISKVVIALRGTQ